MKPTVVPVDPETARAVCAMLLVTLFVGRAAMNFRLWRSFESVQVKVEVGSAKASTFFVSMKKGQLITLLQMGKPRSNDGHDE